MNISRLEINWTSEADGSYTRTLQLNGTILRVVTKPGASGDQPTNGYNATLPDEEGADLFSGEGAGRSNSTVQSFCPAIPFSDGTTDSLMPVSHNGFATFTIAGAGDTKRGRTVIYSKEY